MREYFLCLCPPRSRGMRLFAPRYRGEYPCGGASAAMMIRTWLCFRSRRPLWLSWLSGSYGTSPASSFCPRTVSDYPCVAWYGQLPLQEYAVPASCTRRNTGDWPETACFPFATYDRTVLQTMNPVSGSGLLYAYRNSPRWSASCSRRACRVLVFCSSYHLWVFRLRAAAGQTAALSE